jgi:hypothetical protein
MAYELAYGPIPEGMSVCHHCDNRRCCNPQHLFLGDTAANMGDKKRKMRQTHGAMVNTNKLTEADVLAIRKKHRAGRLSATQLAKQYGCSKSNIQSIVNRKNWAWLPDPPDDTAA